jgi:hypothetical protein
MRPSSHASMLLLASIALASLLFVSCQTDAAETMHSKGSGKQCGTGTTDRPIIPIKLASGNTFCLRMPRYLKNPRKQGYSCLAMPCVALVCHHSGLLLLLSLLLCWVKLEDPTSREQF